MANLDTQYLGLKLKNPVVISSSGLTNSIDKIQKLESYGAAAVVLKSLFEEQINYEAGNLEANNDYPEASDYILNYTKSNNVGQYLGLIEESKKLTRIPVIPSINCISAKDWIDFAKNMESAGADALELNIFLLPMDKKTPASEYEKRYFELVEKVLAHVKIPVAVKLGRNFTNPAYMVDQLYQRGVKGVVLFNRFFEPDIDINSMKMVSAEVLSNPADIRQSLRWIGIVSSLDIKIDIAASTGVHNSEGVIKQVLAGANVAMVCSSLYKYGLQQVESMVNELGAWMDTNGYENIGQIKGKMSYKGIPDPSMYERSQFMKYFSSLQ
jgi:dihydroorotate dehydrogenase (fumarate)